MSTVEIGETVFPLISGTYTDERSIKVDRFLGTGFFIASNGLFVTCKHVIDALETGQNIFMGQLYGPSEGDYLAINNLRSHSKYDLAFGQVSTRRRTKFLLPYQGPFALGLDVGAFGFTDGGKEGSALSVEPRYLRGHISRTSNEAYEFPTKSLCEVSFSVPSGFSGTALLSDDYKIAGILYGNVESKIQAYSINEIEENGNICRETAYRVIEFGLSHSVHDLIAIIKEENIRAFE